jgi:uncharacterized protein YneF (UPF0154 family)
MALDVTLIYMLVGLLAGLIIGIMLGKPPRTLR